MVSVERESTKKNKSKFKAVTKRGGKLVFIAGSESESPTQSLSKGLGFVKSTLARSLGVVNTETGRFESTGVMPEGFRSAKRGGNFVIQSNALSSKSETSEIQMAKKGKKIFG
jgi:hypothetical protein